LQRIEMDDRVSLRDQLANEVGPVILINTFKVAPALLEAWAADAAYLKTKPGFISTQLHRGTHDIGIYRLPWSPRTLPSVGPVMPRHPDQHKPPPRLVSSPLGKRISTKRPAPHQPGGRAMAVLGSFI
jgi:hypothetical protein